MVINKDCSMNDGKRRYCIVQLYTGYTCDKFEAHFQSELSGSQRLKSVVLFSLLIEQRLFRSPDIPIDF